MTFSILTLGCKVNSYESEGVISSLVKEGWVLQTTNDICDVYIVNTCTVTSTSDAKSRQMLSKMRKKNPNAIIVAMGCFAQLHKDEAKVHADVVLGTNQRGSIGELLKSYIESKKQIIQITNSLENHTYEELEVDRLTQTTRGFIKIQDGCENYCTYCAIPYARGPIKSRDPEKVILEIKRLVSEGVKEVIISGINTGTYGKDFFDMSLAKLIKKLLFETSIARIRLSSIELNEVTDELLTVIKESNGRVANHFHIPLQAGSDSVLKRMNRHYITKDYEDKINEIRSMFPGVAITTDCLAGFVGETEEEFKEAYNFINKIHFSSMHIFPYSRRKDTVADGMAGHLKPEIISARAHKLLELAESMKQDYEKNCINKVYKVLIENQKGKYYIGHTSNYLDVHIASTMKNLENTFQLIKIIKIVDNIIYGELLPQGENYE